MDGILDTIHLVAGHVAESYAVDGRSEVMSRAPRPRVTKPNAQRITTSTRFWKPNHHAHVGVALEDGPQRIGDLAG